LFSLVLTLYVIPSLYAYMSSEKRPVPVPLGVVDETPEVATVARAD